MSLGGQAHPNPINTTPDTADAITVDKTPAALWPMALAARVFG
ncbi:hypothetical protein ABZ801_33490 [Actinomadura sp. NPDC047616]